MPRTFLLLALTGLAGLFSLNLALNGDRVSAAAPAAAGDGPVTTTVFLPSVGRFFDPTYVDPFGISMFGYVDAAHGLQHMQAAGARQVMTDFSWRLAEPTRGAPYDWAEFDAKVLNAQAAGMRLYVLFTDNPTWVNVARRGPVPDDKLPDLENLVAAMVQRYNGQNGFPRIDDWSFYGEPDSQSAWGHQGAQFAAMLKRIAPIVHTHNPRARVLIGGLAYDLFTTDTPWPGIFVRDFLTATLATLNTYPGGAAAYLDAVAFHYYPVSVWRWPTLREKTDEIRGILTRHGVGHLPILVPEFSKPSLWPAGDTPAIQARWLVQNAVRGLAMGVEQLHWFQVFDIADDPLTPADDLPRTQGLFPEGDLTQPKPAYFAYQVLAGELKGARYFGPLASPGVEGYVFSQAGARKTVVWGLSADTAVIFSQGCARRVTLLGVVSTILDGGAGDVDGAVNGQIQLTASVDEPIYVGVCP